jgi:predicted transcriptional regulator
MRCDNSHHLVAAAQRRRADTLERARQALQELDETGQRRTVMQIAAHALLTELKRKSPHVNGDVAVSGVTVTARDRRW